MMTNYDEEMINRIKKGDNHAFKYIYDEYYNLLFSIAYEYLKDVFLATNVVDDLIFYLWEKRESIDINITLRGYLVRSVRNRCINLLNTEKERKEVSFSSMGNSGEDTFSHSDEIDYPLAKLLENELEEVITCAINNLPDDCRKVFKMSRMEDKKYEEIASELNISINTVKYHLKNALNRLRSELSKYLLLFFFSLLFLK